MTNLNVEESIKRILSLAVNAPSGHNAQPWSFVKHDSNKVLLYLIPEKDEVLFNYQLRGSYIALGALIENIFILAPQEQLDVRIKYFPDASDKYLIADITFISNTSSEYEFSSLAPFVKNRATNRRAYLNKPLTKTHKHILRSFIDGLPKDRVNIDLFTAPSDVKALARHFSTGDKMLFQNELIHKALFSNVNWTIEDEEARREGLFVETKELSPIPKFLFKYFFSKWSVVRVIGPRGLSENSRKVREKLYTKSSAIVMFSSEDTSHQSLIETGRKIERFWLLCTKHNIRVQPMAVGMLYLAQLVEDNPNTSQLSEIEKEEILNSYKSIMDTYVKDNNIPLFIMRLGYANPPTAQSLKKDFKFAKC